MRADAFAGQMRGLINQAMLGLMVSIGHRTGLFDAMAALPPSSSRAVAEAAGLDERSVREWLGAMVTGGIVEYDGRRGTYWLPREHAGSLTSGAGAGNLARMVSIHGAIEERLVESFRTGATATTAFALDALRAPPRAEQVLALLPGLRDSLLLGADVVEVGDSDGSIARGFPCSRVERATPAELAALAPATVDLVIAIDVLPDLPAPTLEVVRRALRPGGALLCRDFHASSHLADNAEHPLGPALYAVSALRCGSMLGEEKARALILAAGFRELEMRRLDGDLVHALYIARA